MAAAEVQDRARAALAAVAEEMASSVVALEVAPGAAVERCRGAAAAATAGEAEEAAAAARVVEVEGKEGAAAVVAMEGQRKRQWRHPAGCPWSRCHSRLRLSSKRACHIHDRTCRP